MLILKDIEKIYAEKTDGKVEALKGLSVSFRKREFVSILGPSGCGKTTLLNIIGGLDRYTNGDLIINGKSTKLFKDKEWDTYRNHSVGFVFQSYNLIPHQTILENVELTMTLGGVSRTERRKRAKEALVSVGLESKLNKKPNELSGGQMQRVSIARALAGQPDIILADEPTGALDTETSESVMELLKEISKTKLVIMVTHNPDLAYKYSDRIIKMLDGKIIEDTNPFDGREEIFSQTKIEKAQEKRYKKKHSSMSFLTALRLSGKNLLSKKRRTTITSLAASIGIIGIAVILSVSSGMQAYIDKTMLDSASFNYIAISATTQEGGLDLGLTLNGREDTSLTEYPENTTGIYPYEEEQVELIEQKLDNEFISYLEEKSQDLVVDITYSYNVSLNILTKNGDEYLSVSSYNWGESIHNTDYLGDRYTVLAKGEGVETGIPSAANEVALVVDSYNRLSTDVLDALGIAYTEDLAEITYNDLIGKEYRVVYNDGWYTQNADGWYASANTANYEEAYNHEKGITVKIVSVLRENEDVSDSWLYNGIAYSPALTQLVLENNKNSAVALAQYENEEINVTTGKAFTSSGSMYGSSNSYESVLERLGYTQTPTSIIIYPIDVDSRELIIEQLDAWNTVYEGTDKEIIYTDMSSVMTTLLGKIVKIITYVLMAFSIISLVISSIMIAIIIYASVIERTKEIGVLRSIGARKKDISRVFKAEAVLLGVLSGISAVLIALVVNAGINSILGKLVGVTTIASLSFGTAIAMIALSTVLLLLASLIPAKMAAKKEPAVALRIE